MKSVKIRSDFTVKLPDEVRSQMRPGDTLGVLVTADKVTFVREGREPKLSLAAMIERIRKNPPQKPLSDSEVEEIVHRVRQRR